MKKTVMWVIAILNLLCSIIILAKSPLNIIPIHFGIDGQADSFGSKWVCLLMPIFAIILTLAYHIYISYIKKKNSENNNIKVLNILIPCIIFFFILIGWIITAISLNYGTSINTAYMPYAIIALIGILMIILSNFMGKLKPNYTIGVRLSWTLRDETVWKKTHRISGIVGVICGIAMVISGIITMLLNTPVACMILLFVILAVELTVPTIYSYKLYHKIHG